MKPGTSFFLDVLRLASALGVFVSHCVLPWFAAFETPRLLHTAAHGCVMVFFVLSGYLITYTTVGRGRTWPQYCAARLARLYSVAFPAIVLTALLWLIGRHFAPDHYAAFDRGFGAIRIALTAFFLNECWFISAAPPSNMPFWSLSYEFWYYALFGAALFARGCFWRWAAPLGVALICGPKVLLLFPVWLAGAAACVAGQKFALTRVQAALALAALAVACVVGAPHVSLELERFGHPPLFFSGLFLADCALGAVLAAGIFLGDQLLGNARVPAILSGPVKAGAGVTFSIYLFHYPLLNFTAAMVRYDHANPLSVATVGVAVLIVAIALGWWFERKETLKALGKRFDAIFARFTSSPRATPSR